MVMYPTTYNKYVVFSVVFTISMHAEGTVVCCSQDQGSLETKSEPIMAIFRVICEGGAE